jgi:glycosyltransferase involved in cell wall biosynthesis
MAMQERAPSVSVGLPVYNGENYLEIAIRSVLEQTHEDLELIIADNASTDGTEDICRSAANDDPRVRYVRHDTNLGAAANYNYTLALARGRWFKWMAHDDVCRPRFLEACLEVLHAEHDTVLAYPSTVDIDAEGEVLGPMDQQLGFDGDEPIERFRRLMTKMHGCTSFFGVMRTDILRLTEQHGNYPSADRVLLAELGLWGRLREVEEELSLHREHPERFWQVKRTPAEQIAWFDPSRTGQATARMVRSRQLRGYLQAVDRAPVDRRRRWAARRIVAEWAWSHRRGLAGDLLAVSGLNIDWLRTKSRYQD